MSKAALTQVVQRSINDPAFRRQIATDPAALRGYDLTAEESGVIRGMVIHHNDFVGESLNTTQTIQDVPRFILGDDKGA